MNYYVVCLPIVLTVTVALQPCKKVCPYVKPICKCPLRELCKKDKDCKDGQKCCLDCCGGHRCTEPVKEHKCHKRHEEYRTCGSACPRTCENKKPGPCTKQCVQGCFCKDGYLRNKKGDCVKEKQC